MLLSAAHPRLAPEPDLAHARALLEAYASEDAAQRAFRDRMLAFVDEHPRDAHERTCAPGHLTASALVVDSGGERALLSLHAKLGIWVQLGGHCDGDANLPACALREAWEESGVEGLEIDPAPLDLDIHTIPARPARPGRAAEPEHLHLDVRFLVRAPAGARERVTSESRELRWLRASEARERGCDDSVLRLFERAQLPA